MHEILVISAVLAAALVGFTIAGVAGFGGGIITLPVLVRASLSPAGRLALNP